MPKIQFGNVQPAGPLPEGEYTCRIERVERTQTRRGDEMWKLRLVVQDARYAGRVVHDNIVFSPTAMPRVKLLCESLGITTSGVVDLVPEMIEGGVCLVFVGVAEYMGSLQNKVRFDGYAPPESSMQADDER